MNQMDYLKDFKDLELFIHTTCQTINPNSNNGNKLLKSVLTSTLIDLHSLTLLFNKNLSGLSVNQQAWDDFLKHLKRYFIHDTWSITESRVREIAKELPIEIKGRSQQIKEYIEQTLNYIKSVRAQKLLKKARRLSGGKFVEFPKILSSVLKIKLSKNDAKEWEKFFTIFRTMRNASHNNFVAQSTLNIESKWYKKSFVQGDSVQVLCSDIKAIISALYEFFDAIEK